MKVLFAVVVIAAIVAVATAQKTINVLLYNGPAASQDDVEWQIGCFNWANNVKLVPGVTLVSKRSSRVNAQTLQGQDVLLMPGGQNFYPQSAYIDVTAAKAFVQKGGGYYGTCAGAYAACTQIYGNPEDPANPFGPFNVTEPWTYDANGRPNQQGWGISHANCNVFYYVGTANLKFTDAGSKILNYTGIVPVDHHNGPSMEAGGTIVATFNDTPARGKNAIVVDTYGSGRVIQVSPHPEHSRLQKCMMVARAALWAGNGVTEFE
jgi:glutamine amidotransferase-like uncharacterized protein